MHVTDLTVYAWRFEVEELRLDLNMAVPADDNDRLCQLLKDLPEDECLSLPLRSIPDGSPHHLDDKKNIYDAPREMFKTLEICISSDTERDISTLTLGRQLIINIPRALIAYFLSGLEESKLSGYIFDNSINILTSTEQILAQRAQLNFWSCEKRDIVFY